MDETPEIPGQSNDASLDVESFGVLVGWTHVSMNGRLILTIEAARSAKDNVPRDIQKHHFMMTDNQALLLGNNLLGISNLKPPVRRSRVWLARLFGK